ncbi:hypothetical protein G3I37_04985 [Streptomyces anulatus]|uniref:Uncharacterized protein n=1 Tax=Streptomyces anulatus TaxID=1892 RepID=A0A6G3SP80_STRAQ|nr:hypothetical protein [Streptomyces anulatus]NEC02489.1 hypothetical protein [Streptomyces anulatus]NED24259.1 hypothetical protein [Streptomyces anulatus]
MSLTRTSTTIARTTSAPVNRARHRWQTYTASPTTAAEGPVSTTWASEAGSPRKPSGPSAMPIRAYSVPASVARYATASVRHRPRHSSARPNTSRIWASAPHTGRSSAGTNRDSGVRRRASRNGSSARTAPRFCTGR